MSAQEVEDRNKESRQALDELEQILNQTRPKNLREGVATGCNNIIQGAVGAVGVAVLMPMTGLAIGTRQGGLLGGIVGLTGGAVAGALGAMALALGGAVSGVAQIGRGIFAVPQQVIAPMQGKWWNETEGKWILTDMKKEKEAVEAVPSDDSDILGPLQKELDDKKSTEFPASSGNVVDMYYYNILQVPADADGQTIKRRYYVLARENHPDKNPDNAEAAETFKAVSEAYQVLSDPELRKRYNEVGRKGLTPDKTDTDGPDAKRMDPKLLFAFLFGSDRFYDYTGPLATATSASVGDSEKVSYKDARTLQKRRITRLAVKLIDKITPYVEVSKASENATEKNSVLADIATQWKTEAEELATTSFGYPLVTTIGKVYNCMAVTYEGSIESGQGLPKLSKWAARQKALLDKRKAAQETSHEGMMASLEIMVLQGQLRKQLEEAKTDDERQRIQKELEDKSVAILVRVMWTTAVVDITTTLYETTKMVFFDQSVDKQTRKHRALAVKELGRVWMEIAKPEKSPDDPKHLYEEAAFAAMLETIKRKDEAAHGGGGSAES